MSKREFKTGTTELDDLIFDRKGTSVAISLRIPGDVLDAVKASAQKVGVGYQTLINDTLRAQFILGQNSNRNTLSEREVSAIRKMLERRKAEVEKKAGSLRSNKKKGLIASSVASASSGRRSTKASS